jgi:predicted dehydrogenase
MEKPMAVSLAQADRILDAARDSGCQLMVGYMKRYDAGNELVKEKVERWVATGEAGPITFARNHGFCGDWIAGLRMPLATTDEPMPAVQAVGPDWLPPEYLDQYLGYLQQYTHNVNLLRWFLGAGDDVTVRAVDLDDDGYTGVVSFDMAGTRAIIESGRITHFRWDEHTQIYFRDGWIKTWAPPLLLKEVPAEVEIYRAADVQTVTRPVPRPAWDWSYRREAEHFIGCLLTGREVRSSGQDTRTDVRLFEDVFRMHLTRRGVL